MGVKDIVMKLARIHEDKEIREKALIALQKLLIENLTNLN
jgi:hypothetical protein